MRRFFVRELSRLAPVALASVFLGGLIYAGLTLTAPPSWAHGAPYFAYVVVLLGAPWLLGAAAIAPDAESGALVFMATLPVKPWKRLLTRLTAAASLAALAPVLVYLVLAPLDGGIRSGVLIPKVAGFEPVAPFVFGGAVLASATIRNALAAFVVAPVFAAVPGFLVFSLAAYWRSDMLFLYLFLPLPLFLLAGAWAAFSRGDHFGRLWSPRSLRLGLGVVLAPLAVVGGLSSVVFAYDRVFPVWTLADELRWGWFARDSAGESVALPQGQVPVSLSPDGRLVLTVPMAWWDYRDQGLDMPLVLHDLTGDASPRVGAWPSFQNRTLGGERLLKIRSRQPEMRYVMGPVCWRGDQPYLVTEAGLRTFGGELIGWGLDVSVLIEDAGGGVVLLRELDGGMAPRRWLATPAGVEALPGLPPHYAEFQLSPVGRWVLAVPMTGVEARVRVLEVGRDEAWRGPLPVDVMTTYDASGASIRFAPGEDRLCCIDVVDTQAVVIDLSRLEAPLLRFGVDYRSQPFWGPAGELIVPGLAWYEFDASGEATQHAWEGIGLDDQAAFPQADRPGPYLVFDAGQGDGQLVNLRTWQVETLDYPAPVQ
jgi:hypothetical protein